MGKSAQGKQQVNEYNLSQHFGICSELDAITGIFIGEKQAWTGDVSVGSAITVQNEYLFGGPKKEGGVRGIAYYLPGDQTQVMPQGLAARRGLSSTTSPGYRGVASVYFVGSMSPDSATTGALLPTCRRYGSPVGEPQKGLVLTMR